MYQMPTHAQYSAHADMEPERQRQVMGAHVGDPGFHRVCRKDIGVAFLNRQPRRRLGVVADPDLIGQPQDAEVGTAAATGTALPDHLGMAFAKCAPDVIQPVNVADP